MPDNADSRSIRGNGYRHCEIFIQKKKKHFCVFVSFPEQKADRRSPSKHAGSDLEAFWLRPVMEPESGRIVYPGSASDSVPFFQRRPGSYCANRAGSDLDGLVRFWPNASGPEASQSARIIGPGSSRTQPARYQFPTLRLLVAFFHTRPSMITLRKTRPDQTWFWLTGIYFGQTDPVRKQVGVQESSGPLLANAAEPIRIGCESEAARLPSI